jgi:hypothetical protein
MSSKNQKKGQQIPDDAPFRYVTMTTTEGSEVAVPVHYLVAMKYLGFRLGTTQTVQHRNMNDTLNNSLDNLHLVEKPNNARKHLRGIIQYVLSPFLVVNRFASLAAAQEETDIPKTKIKRVCHGADPEKVTNGYYFCYLEYFEEVVDFFGPPANLCDDCLEKMFRN